MSSYARDLVAEHGDDTPITWVHRDDRFGEKLATPDTSIADLIGEVDPIKVAEGRYLSDELTLHYGLVPRTNRGIFAINELPDLAERIQVGLLNVLEERDIQVRGYKIRLPLDVLLVASANPEDYTNRGRIITPLKDRFGARSAPTTRSRSRPSWRSCARRPGFDRRVDGPRRRRGARLPRRGHRHGQPPRPGEHPRQPAQRGERPPVGHQPRGRRRQRPASRAAVRRARRSSRVDDLEALAASSGGKIEIESLDEGREGAIFDNLVKGAVLTVFKERVAPEQTRRSSPRSRRARSPTPARTRRRPISPASSSGAGARAPVAALTGGDESPAAVAAAVAFVLEGLHLSKRLNKDTSDPAAHLPPPASRSRSGHPASRAAIWSPRTPISGACDQFVGRTTGPGAAHVTVVCPEAVSDRARGDGFGRSTPPSGHSASQTRIWSPRFSISRTSVTRSDDRVEFPMEVTSTAHWCAHHSPAGSAIWARIPDDARRDPARPRRIVETIRTQIRGSRRRGARFAGTSRADNLPATTAGPDYRPTDQSQDPEFRERG